MVNFAENAITAIDEEDRQDSESIIGNVNNELGALSWAVPIRIGVLDVDITSRLPSGIFWANGYRNLLMGLADDFLVISDSETDSLFAKADFDMSEASSTENNIFRAGELLGAQVLLVCKLYTEASKQVFKCDIYNIPRRKLESTVTSEYAGSLRNLNVRKINEMRTYLSGESTITFVADYLMRYIQPQSGDISL